MSPASSNVSLKQSLEDRLPIRLIGAHNGLGGKIAEEVGFSGIWASSLEISASRGVPDDDSLDMGSSLRIFEEISRSVSIPVIADCSTGFGGPESCRDLGKACESAGVAGLCVEDQKFPKVNSLRHDSRQQLEDENKFADKISAIAAARSSPRFVILARLEALILGFPQAEAHKRALRYLAAGADGIIVHSRQEEPREVLDFCRAWKKLGPLGAIPTTYHDVLEEELNDAGVNVVIYANYGIRATIKAMKEALQTIHREKTARNVAGRVASVEDVFRLQSGLSSHETG